MFELIWGIKYLPLIVSLGLPINDDFFLARHFTVEKFYGHIFASKVESPNILLLGPVENK